MKKPDRDELIKLLGLQPLHGEGGLFRQSYRSSDVLLKTSLPERYGSDKPAGTAIYYFLTDEPDSFSALHRLKTDEIYHFYLGDPVELLVLFPDRTAQKVLLGPDLLNRQQVQFVVPRHAWQGSRLVPGGQYALLGTTMAPGFTDDDFELAEKDLLLGQYPEHAEMIDQLTRPGKRGMG